jgi:hypothetical protein
VQQALRPYATAGVAIVGASLIAVTPMAPRLPDIQTRDVALTAGEDTLSDILAPWIDVYNTASENATTLINNEALAPAVGLQQLIANDSGYLQDFFNDPTSSTVTTISQEMQENLAAVLTGFTLQDPTSQTLTTVTEHTLNGAAGVIGTHAGLFQEIGSFLPASINPAEVTPIVDFLASPDSGIIMGMLGPEISPFVELFNCITAGDDFNTTLADVTGAFFNGADLNLDSLIPAIEESGFLPAGMSIENLDFAFGGLLTPGDVSVGPYELFNSSGDVTASIPAVGGSIFNSLGISLSNAPVLGSPDIASEAIGPIGAWEAWEQTIGALLGSGWDGKGAVGVTAPLTGVDLPTIPADFLDGGTIPATAAADLSSLVQEVLAAF